MAAYPYADIFKRLLAGRISPQEAETLIEWLSRDEHEPETRALLLEQLQQVVADEQITDDVRQKMEARLPAILGRNRRTIPIWVRYSSAAAAVLLMAAAIYLSRQKSKPADLAKTTVKAIQDIAPGRQGAILTLSDGRTMTLDSLGNGVVATQNGSKIILNNGRLAYSESPAAATGTVAYNTTSTPKGRQFQLTLPDGTKVWLNAASSLRYPIAFTGAQRQVDVTGEAYFEVAPDPQKPFFVNINETTRIQVLGTHFNINAYTDEAAINTTLLEGSVAVISNREKTVLKPGQQARVKAAQPIVVSNADTEKVIAWKNGIFDFQNARLEEVMRQLERWYDIDVVYEKGIPSIEFIGKMGRDLSLSEVLGGLQLSKVHFRLEAGRRLVVLP